MNFDDDQHIARIAAALWRRTPTGRAAVLVGAGFSPNAQPLRDSQPVMPGWTALVERMIGDLYGDAGQGDPAHHKAARETSSATSAALRIAQEYEAEFGRDALDRLITENVPDEAFGPGPLHRLLLELPWAEVLTTNWDTLLERAARDVEDQVYGIVRTVEDIPSATTPRIVKLHGSFPSNRPFIFTEEDFRTYPELFAPFLNLARQATMENVLVLVGFSGDDPNFLFWSGWVRDQLGDHAPTIYLVGPLGLSPSRRKMLEKRRVQPIDLTRIPSYGDWPEETRRGLAVQWFLERLTAAKPYRRVRWPRVPVTRTNLALLPPSPNVRAPQSWPSPGGSTWTAASVEAEILPTLGHNRLLYPGWIVAPRRARSSIWNFLQYAINEAGGVLPKLEPLTALALGYEFNWLSERALLPLFNNLETPIRALLEDLDIDALEPEARDQAQALMFALLRFDRESDRPEGVAKWDKRIAAMALSPEASDRLRHERCLWALLILDYDLLDARLAEWTVLGDPFWMVRKAALLAENDRMDEARSLSKTALATIRARTDKDGEDIASWSREAYALLFRSSAAASEIESWEEGLQERDTVSDRLYTLAARGCGAEDEFDGYAAEVRYAPPQIRPEVERIRGFDVGNVALTEHWSTNSPILSRRQALEALRFYEEIGSPARIWPVTVAASAYAGIARWLHDVDIDRTIAALTRTAGVTEKESLGASFSRDTVAALDDEVAQRWGARFLVAVRALAERLNNPAMAPAVDARLQLLVEMLSRMTARRADLAAPALELAFELYAHPARRHSLEKPLDRLFKRAFKALPDPLVPLYRRRLFETEIPATDNSYYNDPAGAAAAGEDFRPDDPVFAEIIARTTTAIRDPAKRYAAVMRIHWLHEAGALTPEQLAAYAAALWDDGFLEDGLPGGTPLRPWVFSLLPYPPGVDPSAAARARVLALENLDGEDALGILSGLAAETPAPVSLSVRELKPYIKMLLAKAQPEMVRPRKTRPIFASRNTLDWSFWQTFDNLFGLAAKHASLRALFKTYFAQSPRLETARSVVAAVDAAVITLTFGQDLLQRAWSGDERETMSAAIGSIRWVQTPPQGKPLPPIIWDIAADSVVSMGENSVMAALDFFRAAYTQEPKAVPRALDNRLMRGLQILLKRTGQTETRSILLFDPGAARRAGARLVAAMDKAGRAPDGLIDTWREAARQEGIGEIRDGLGTEPKA